MLNKKGKVPGCMELLFPSKGGRRFIQHHKGVTFPHMSPDSVFVAVIGNSWELGAWQKVTDMLEHTSQWGITCCLHEFANGFAAIPYSTLSAMRNTACVYASNSGYEWLLLVENDILPEPDMLVQLLEHQMPLMVPFIQYQGKGWSVSQPPLIKNMGVIPIAWSVFSCVLIWTKVLNCFPDCSPFNENKGEGPFFMRLVHFGQKLFMDTYTELKLATDATYGGRPKSLKDSWEFWEKADKRRRQPPDRSPIDPNNPNQRNGIYYPPSVLPPDKNKKESVC